MKLRFILLSLILILAFGCNTILNKEEADRSLKVLNSNLVNLFTVSSEQPEIQALFFLFKEPTSPISFNQKKGFFSKDTSIIRNIKDDGIYDWNASKSYFEKKDTADDIIINFPYDGKNGEKATFILKEFETEDCKNRPEFPVKANGKLLFDDKEKITLRHQATIENNLPLGIHSIILTDKYEVDLNYFRTRKDKTGIFKINTFLKTRGLNIIKVEVDADIEYSKTGYYFKQINFELKIFDHQIVGDLNYGQINPTASDYVSSFNKNSKIEILENNGDKVGDIVLGKSGEGELLDYFVRFSNGEEVLLKEYIPLLNKILDFKY